MPTTQTCQTNRDTVPEWAHAFTITTRHDLAAEEAYMVVNCTLCGNASQLHEHTTVHDLVAILRRHWEINHR